MKEPLVREIMTNLVVTFRKDDSLRDAAHRLLTNRISGGPVVERGRVIGIGGTADGPRRVSDCMTHEVVSIGPDKGLWEAARLISRRAVKRLPVV
ncbi:MAG: CBS domain-containing protein, partial [Actinomycetota bacterium]